MLRSIGLKPTRTYSDSSDSEEVYYNRRRRSTTSRNPSSRNKLNSARPKPERQLSRIESPKHSDRDEWDTDYDPRDKYYLTAGESDHDQKEPVRESKSAISTKSSSRRKEEDRPRKRPSEKPSSSRRPRDDSSSRYLSPEPRKASSKSTSRDVQPDSTTRKPTRPNMTRAPSSALSHRPSSRAVRPSVARARSGNVKPRPAYMRKLSEVLGGSSKRDSPRPIRSEKMSTMGYVALAAAVAEGLKTATDGSPLIMKGMSMGTAALGAVAIDSLLKPKHSEGIRHEALRSVAEVAIAHAIMTPVLSRMSKTVRGEGI